MSDSNFVVDLLMQVRQLRDCDKRYAVYQIGPKGEINMAGNSVNFELLTPVTFLKRTAMVYGHKDAVVHNDKRFTYRQFENRVHRLASALYGIGISKGDKVAFLSPNIPPMLEAHFAVPMIGATLVSINI